MKRSSKAAVRKKPVPAAPVVPPRARKPDVSRQLGGVDRSRAHSSAAELTWSAFDRKIHQLARIIQASYQPDAVVGIAHGGVFVGGALARALECDFFPVRISRRSRDKVVRKQPRPYGAIPPELKGLRVLLVDDVISSGDTMTLAEALLEKVSPKEVRSACLVQRSGGHEPDWSAMVSEGLVIFPWDYAPVSEDGRFGA